MKNKALKKTTTKKNNPLAKTETPTQNNNTKPSVKRNNTKPKARRNTKPLGKKTQSHLQK